MHGQDDERDEVVVAFCVNTGRLLGTFEGSRESLLGGGGSLPNLDQSVCLSDHFSPPSPKSPLPGSRFNFADLSSTISSC